MSMTVCVTPGPMHLLVWGLIAAVLACAVTWLVRRIALRLRVVDTPSEPRKVHRGAIPLLGGTAVFVAIALCLALLLMFGCQLTDGEIRPLTYLGFLFGGLILMVGGYLDDRYTLPPRLALIAPVMAAIVAVASGMQIEKLSNPLGGVLYLSPIVSAALVFVWLLVVMFTTKFLDGLDGLATGVSGIGSFMIMLLALTTAYFQPDVALFAAIVVGALSGFLPWNFHPAKIFLGEGGSTFVGFAVGTLAVISGGKVATALLVLAIPLFDVIWVILRRWRSGGVKNVTRGDRKHLHHRLLDLGWGQRRIVLSYYAVAAMFGVVALFLQTRGKLIALVILGVLMIAVAAYLVRQEYAKPTRVH